MKHTITLENVRSYASEANLMKALEKFGLKEYREFSDSYPMRYIISLTPEGRWTATFLVSEYFRKNNTGGYLGIASQHGFMSV